MRLISWNVNGLRSCLGKGFLDFCAFADADVICLQETKMRPEQAAFDSSTDHFSFRCHAPYCRHLFPSPDNANLHKPVG